MKKPIPAVILAVAIPAVLLCGCDLQKDTEAESVKTAQANGSSPVATGPGGLEFYYGQSIADVQALLGEPNGTVTVSNQTILLYGGENLKFIDGKWINPHPDTRERIADSKKAVVKQAAIQKIKAKKEKLRVVTPPEKKSAKPAAPVTVTPAAAPFGRDQIKVITFRDDQDLLAQLKQVPKGQRIETRCTSPGYVDTGIKCSDTAAKAAFMKKEEAMMDKIRAELDRISGH